MINQVNKHERDANIRFIPEGHKYIIGDGSRSYISVTSFVKSIFPSFNPDYALKKMRSSPKWNITHPHFMKTDDEIKEEWATACKEASEAGSGLHDQIDKYLNNSLETEPETQEWGMFKEFISTLDGEPYRTEWMIYDEPNKICGTLDFLVKNTDGTYTIIDWKRSKSIHKPRTTMISNTTFWHYCIQLNLYKYILEKHYGIRITKMTIVQMHPEKGKLTTYDMPDKQDDIKEYIRKRNNPYDI